MLHRFRVAVLRFLSLLVTIAVTLYSSTLLATDPPANWDSMSPAEKTSWLFQHATEIGPDDLEKFLGTSLEEFDAGKIKQLSAAEILNLLTDPKGVPIFSASTPDVVKEEERHQLPKLTKEQIAELLSIDYAWRKLIGSSLNHRFGRVSESEFNIAIDLIEKMEGFKNRLLKSELESSPFKRLLYRQLSEQTHISSSIPERLEVLSDFFQIISRRAKNKDLQLLLDSISRNTGIFHIEFVSFRTIERFFIFEMRRELRKVKIKERIGVNLTDNEKLLIDFLEKTVGNKNAKAVKVALALPGAIQRETLNFISINSYQTYAEQRGHEAFLEILKNISLHAKAGGFSPVLYTYSNRANLLLEFFESNKDLIIELLNRTSRIEPTDIPEKLRIELQTLNSSSGRSSNGEIIKHPSGLGIKNSLIYEGNRFTGFVGNTLHFYLSILLSDELLRLTYYTGEYQDSMSPLPFFSSGKELLFNVGSHIHFATFSIYVAANRSAYNSAVKSLVTKLPVLKFIAGRNPVGLFFSEFVGFMPGMTANSAMYSSIAHTATPEAYFLLTRGYFAEAGRLVSLIWREQIAQLSLGAKMATVTGVFYAMRLGQQLIICAFRGATAATYVVNPLVGFAWTVTTFAVAAIVEHYLADWFTSLEATSYIDSSTDKLLDTETELISPDKLIMAFKEIPGLEEGIQKKFGLWPQTYLYFRDYYDETNVAFRKFIEDCWASLLAGNGAFGTLISSIIDHADKVEIVRRIDLIERYIQTKEKHIITGMNDENSSKELDLALQFIDDLSISFEYRFKHQRLNIIRSLFEDSARVRIYSSFIPKQFSDAKGLIASNFSIERAYSEYENSWNRENELASERILFFNDINEMQSNRNKLKLMEDGEEKEKLAREIDEHLTSYAKEIAKGAFIIEFHELIKKDFWSRCIKSGFLSLDGRKRDKHPCAKQQNSIEAEWMEIKSTPRSRFILDNYVHYKNSLLFEWGHKKAEEFISTADYYHSDGITWIRAYESSIFSVNGGISFTKEKSSNTPWSYLSWFEPTSDGNKAAEAFILNTEIAPSDGDHDLIRVEDRGSGLLLTRLKTIVAEENLLEDLNTQADIQASWIKSIVTDPLSGNYNEKNYTEAVEEVGRISQRDWSALALYKNSQVNKKSLGAKTSEELAFWLNGYARAKRKDIGASASNVLQEWWLKKAIDSAESLAKERESFRLINDGVIPIPEENSNKKFNPYRALIPNQSAPAPRIKAVDLNDPEINRHIVDFFSKADPTGVLIQNNELPHAITNSMSNPCDKDESGDQSSKEIEELTADRLNQMLSNMDGELKDPENDMENIIETMKKVSKWFNNALLEAPGSEGYSEMLLEITAILTDQITSEKREENIELIDFAYAIIEYTQAEERDQNPITSQIVLFERSKELLIELEAKKVKKDLSDIIWSNDLMIQDVYIPSNFALHKIGKLLEALKSIGDGKELSQYLVFCQNR